MSNTTIALLPGTHICTNAVNKVVSVSNATNFALIADNSSAGATIKCNGSIGFKLNFITNLTITGITFTECGSYIIHHECNFSASQQCKRIPGSITFTLYLNYSTDAYISNIIITDGNGIGSILMNPKGQTTITRSHISYNDHGNLYIFSGDNKLKDTLFSIK